MQILDGKIERNEVNQKSNGGTELMTEALVKHVDPEMLDGVQIIVSRMRHELLPDKHKIFYCHDLPGDPEAQNVLGNGGWSRFHKIVFVSHWQQQQFINAFGIPWSKTTVLKNAIVPIDVDVRKKYEAMGKDKPYNIVYHTTPHRGLKLLVPAVLQILKERDDVRLHVYSSFKIYGWDDGDKQFEALFNQARSSEHISVNEPVSNEKMHEILKDMDIFAYPSTWPETSCISLMEAMSAGCVCIHSNFAALPETSTNWTMMYDFNENEQDHANHFYGFLRHTLDYLDTKNESLLNKLQGQKSYTDLYYNWEVRKIEWAGLLQSVKNMELELEEGMENAGLDRFGVEEFSYASG